MPIVARQSSHLPPSVLPFFWRGHGWFFDSWPYLLTYTIAQLFVNYIVRSYQRSQSFVLAPMLPCTGGATIIDRPPLLSLFCHFRQEIIWDGYSIRLLPKTLIWAILLENKCSNP